MKEWDASKFDMLVQETVRKSLGLLTDIRQGQSGEQILKTFTKMALQGKIRHAVRFVTERGMGVRGDLKPEDIVPNKDETESTVLDVRR